MALRNKQAQTQHTKQAPTTPLHDALYTTPVALSALHRTTAATGGNLGQHQQHRQERGRQHAKGHWCEATKGVPRRARSNGPYAEGPDAPVSLRPSVFAHVTGVLGAAKPLYNGAEEIDGAAGSSSLPLADEAGDSLERCATRTVCAPTCAWRLREHDPQPVKRPALRGFRTTPRFPMAT